MIRPPAWRAALALALVVPGGVTTEPTEPQPGEPRPHAPEVESFLVVQREVEC